MSINQTQPAFAGLMQDVPLSILHLFDRAERYYGRKTITTATATGIERTTYADGAVRTRKLGTTERHHRVADMLELVQLTHLADRYPHLTDDAFVRDNLHCWLS